MGKTKKGGGVLNKKTKNGKGPKKDFEKIKNKVGKSKKAARNETKTDFKAVKIHMPNQHAIESKGANVTRKNMNLTDLLAHVKHHNIGVRVATFSQLRELLSNDNGLLELHLGRIVDSTSLAVLDPVLEVRKEYRSFLQWILDTASTDLRPFYPFLHMQVKASLTHVDANIRKEGLNLLEFLLAHKQGSSILHACSASTINLLVSMSSRNSFVEERIVRILRKLLSLQDEENAAPSTSVLSIEDMVARKVDANRKESDALEGISTLALRAYKESGPDIEGLTSKLNACILLHKVKDDLPWGDITRVIEFPLSTMCPPQTHRGTHRALVDSINLHVAHLLTQAPAASSLSGTFSNHHCLERIAGYVQSIVTRMQLRNSDAPPIDEDEEIALQTVKAKVEKIIVILRALLHSADRGVMAKIISHLCLPKNDSVAELTSPRVIAMMSFVEEVYKMFDDDTVTPWVLVWPKVLWHAPSHRSAALRRILGVAKFSSGLLRKIQPLLMPFFVGIGSQLGRILECTPEDQALAVSMLFYMDHNWTNISAKVAPLLGTSLSDSAKELLIDILLNKESTGDETKLKLLLLLLQTDAGVRKATSFTTSMPCYWDNLALPLAHHARKLCSTPYTKEEKPSSVPGASYQHNWLAYLLACAQSSGYTKCAPPRTAGATGIEEAEAEAKVVRDILKCIQCMRSQGFDASAFARALYEIAPSVGVSSSEIYERACKLSFIAGNARVLEALILDKKDHDISTENWGAVDVSMDCDESPDENLCRAVSKATVSEMRTKLASWDLAVLPML